MSKDISHDITAALGLRLPFHAGTGLTYNTADPDENLYAPVTISDNGTVVLAAADAVPDGSIVLIEPNDGRSAKVTVELGPVVRFNVAEGTTFAAGDFGGGVLADGTGGVKPAGAATASFGRLTSVRRGVATVLS